MKFGLIGKSLLHSFSAAYFNARFQNEGPAGALYQNCELAQIEAVKPLLKDSSWTGFNVTIPYKEAIIPYLDELSPEARAIGAVNTLQRKRGQWIGHNTDHLGFRRALEEVSTLKQISEALVLGSGGASKAVQYALGQMGISSRLVSRNPGDGAVSYSEAQRELQNIHLIINTTPLGTYPQVEQSPPLKPSGDLRDHFFMDLIYNPKESRWLQKAREAGAQTLNGYSMLIHQAEAAWEIWQEA